MFYVIHGLLQCGKTITAYNMGNKMVGDTYVVSSTMDGFNVFIAICSRISDTRADDDQFTVIFDDVLNEDLAMLIRLLRQIDNTKRVTYIIAAIQPVDHLDPIFTNTNDVVSVPLPANDQEYINKVLSDLDIPNTKYGIDDNNLFKVTS